MTLLADWRVWGGRVRSQPRNLVAELPCFGCFRVHFVRCKSREISRAGGIKLESGPKYVGYAVPIILMAPVEEELALADVQRQIDPGDTTSSYDFTTVFQ